MTCAKVVGKQGALEHEPEVVSWCPTTQGLKLRGWDSIPEVMEKEGEVIAAEGQGQCWRSDDPSAAKWGVGLRRENGGLELGRERGRGGDLSWACGDGEAGTGQREWAGRGGWGPMGVGGSGGG